MVSEVSAYGHEDLIETGFYHLPGKLKNGKKGIHETMGLRHWASGHGGKWTLRGGKQTRVLKLPEILALRESPGHSAGRGSRYRPAEFLR